MSLLFNMLSRLVIAFLSRSKGLLISWLQSPSAVILEFRKIKPIIVSLSICHKVMGPDAMILVFWMLSFMAAFSLSQLAPLSLFSVTVILSFYYFYSFALFFNWRIIALQNFVVFCQTSTWISHRYICMCICLCISIYLSIYLYIYIYLPSHLNLPPISLPIPLL